MSGVGNTSSFISRFGTDRIEIPNALPLLAGSVVAAMFSQVTRGMALKSAVMYYSGRA